MKKKTYMHHLTACIAAVLSLCLTGSSLVQAGTVYELYELVEGASSENGYIPAYDPAEDLSGESVSVIAESDTPVEQAPEESPVFGDGSLEGNSVPAADTVPVFDESAFGDGSAVSDFESGIEDTYESTEETISFYSEETEGAEQIPSNEISVFSDEEAEDMLSATGLPVRYSLADVSGTTAVKNQKNLGICWAFSSLESIETGLIKKGLADSSLSLSETHLAYSAFHGTTSDADDPTSGETFLPMNSKWTRIGGNRFYSIATLSRGYGPVYEADYPLSLIFQADAADATGSSVSILDSVISDQAKNDSLSRLRNCYWLFDVNADGITDETRTSRINDIKRFIMNYGGVEIGLYTNSYAYPYNEETNSFYCAENRTANHSVTLIGWDDTKVTQASKPGAFLIQNSWGSEKGENGLFWVSYEDKSIKSPSFYEMENRTLGSSSNEIVYQYDGTGYGSVIKPAEPSDTLRISGANVFTANEAQYLKKVSFYAGAAPLSYKISIYRYVQSSPDTGTLVYTQEGKNTYAGYYTVDLQKSIPIAAGEKFAIQLQFNHKNGYVPHEKLTNRLYTANPGESYLYDGKTWTDMQDLGFNCNICIKAFAEPTSEKITMQPQTPALKSAVETNNTQVILTVDKTANPAHGYDFVLGTSSSFLKTKTYLKRSVNNTAGEVTFSYLDKGTYYAAVRSYYLNAAGKRVVSSWSAVVPVTVTVGRPAKQKISSVTVTNGNLATVKVTPTAKKISGYIYAVGTTADFLTQKKYYKIGWDVQATSYRFDYLPKGTMYAAVRAYNLDASGNRVLGSWSSVVSFKVPYSTPDKVSVRAYRTANGVLRTATTTLPSGYNYEYILTTKNFSSTTYSPKNRVKVWRTSKTTKVTVKGITPGTYYLGVRGYRMYGSTKVCGKWTVKKITVK